MSDNKNDEMMKEMMKEMKDEINAKHVNLNKYLSFWSGTAKQKQAWEEKQKERWLSKKGNTQKKWDNMETTDYEKFMEGWCKFRDCDETYENGGMVLDERDIWQQYARIYNLFGKHIIYDEEKNVFTFANTKITKWYSVYNDPIYGEFDIPDPTKKQKEALGEKLKKQSNFNNKKMIWGYQKIRTIMNDAKMTWKWDMVIVGERTPDKKSAGTNYNFRGVVKGKPKYGHDILGGHWFRSWEDMILVHYRCCIRPSVARAWFKENDEYDKYYKDTPYFKTHEWKNMNEWFRRKAILQRYIRKQEEIDKIDKNSEKRKIKKLKSELNKIILPVDYHFRYLAEISIKDKKKKPPKLDGKQISWFVDIKPEELKGKIESWFVDINADRVVEEIKKWDFTKGNETMEKEKKEKIIDKYYEKYKKYLKKHGGELLHEGWLLLMKNDYNNYKNHPQEWISSGYNENYFYYIKVLKQNPYTREKYFEEEEKTISIVPWKKNPEYEDTNGLAPFYVSLTRIRSRDHSCMFCLQPEKGDEKEDESDSWTETLKRVKDVKNKFMDNVILRF